MPAVLCVRERPGVVDLLPEHERIDRGHRKRERDAAERAQTVPLPPGEQRKRGQQRDAGGAREDRQTGEHAGACKTVPFCDREGREHEQEEERLAVHGLQEQAHREHGEIQDAALLRPRAPSRSSAKPVEQEERAEAAGERSR